MNRLFAYTPTLPQAWGLVALALLSQIAGGAVAGVLMPLIGGAAQAWTVMFSYVLSFALMALIVVRLGGRTAEEVVGVPVRRLSPAVFVLLACLMPALAVTVEPLTAWIPMPDKVKQLFESTFARTLPTFLVAVVVAPVAEEWLCRGVILKGLLRHYAPRKAIIWSAILFGVLHANPWQAIPACCIAIAIGWVYWRTRSLWYCIFMHAVNNGMAFLVLLLFPDAPADATTADLAGGAYAVIYAVAVLIVLLAVLGVRRMTHVEA
ncbi:MAG: CPBP family intramembrane metalloprotease [Prevotellaceae bacterium]|jgi:membrane protease YdiL (CAAX protease family)|nr:CPBP family intramembrane metalloprotease [Prevotellaceae bacterium]